MAPPGEWRTNYKVNKKSQRSHHTILPAKLRRARGRGKGEGRWSGRGRGGGSGREGEEEEGET